MSPEPSCIFQPCVATWEHYHGGFPGGSQDPAYPDGEGVPIYFTGPNPDPTAIRDYNGAVIGHRATLGNRPDVATPRVAKATRGAKGAR